MLAKASSSALGHRPLGKLCSHLPTLPNTRADVVDGGAIPFSMVPCRTGGEGAPVRSLLGGGHQHPHSSLLPLWQARPGRTLSPWQPKAPQCLTAASREGSGFKTILRDCFCLYYPNYAPPYTHSCSSPQRAFFPIVGRPVTPPRTMLRLLQGWTGGESFLPDSCPSGWTGTPNSPVAASDGKD